jgi:hypothetical protein
MRSFRIITKSQDGFESCSSGKRWRMKKSRLKFFQARVKDGKSRRKDISLFRTMKELGNRD